MYRSWPHGNRLGFQNEGCRKNKRPSSRKPLTGVLTEGAAEKRVKRGCLRGPWFKEPAAPFSAHPQDLQAERTLTGWGWGVGTTKTNQEATERGSRETSGGGAIVPTHLLRLPPTPA